MLKKSMLSVIFILGITFFVSDISAGVFKSNVKKVENFSLKDYNGEAHSLNDYKDSKAIVLMFIATQCPVSNAYNQRMAELYKKYNEKGVVFLGINSNKTEPVDEIKSHSKKNDFDFPVLKDEKNKIADKLEATVTPEIFVINSNFDVLYHGRIDDSRNPGNVNNRDLEKALNEILDGKKVSNTETVAFGCTIKRI